MTVFTVAAGVCCLIGFLVGGWPYWAAILVALCFPELCFLWFVSVVLKEEKVEES
jgi:hypothetical protein